MSYVPFILNNFSRVLTQIDKDPHSKTYGCCDRNFWHLKIRDFSSAILQQSGLTAILLYELNFKGNPCYKNENVREWSRATLYYWAKIQLSDGSYNEYYPNEHGFPPTAFSLYSACIIYNRLKLNDDFIKQKIRKTALFLSRNIETQVLNQEMASITALYCAGKLLDDNEILKACKSKLNILLSAQSEDGWFSEYGGADLGYLSVTLDMMAEYWYLSKDESVISPINKMINFIQYFVHPDGTVGGEYGSRNTTYFLPNGVEVAAGWGNKIALELKKKLFSNTEDPLFFMNSVDDRYFSHYVVHSFLRSLEKEMSGNNITQNEEPIIYSPEKFFPESRLVSYKNDSYSAFIGLAKGGVIKAYIGEKEVFVNCGYRVQMRKGDVAFTNWQDPSYQVEWDSGSGKVSGTFNRLSPKVPSPILHMGLRVIAAIFGKRVISVLKNILILKPKKANIAFTREFQLNNSKIIINDTIKSPIPINLERANNMSLRHVASGKFFMLSDLLANAAIVAENASSIAVKTEINMLNGEVEEAVTVHA
ncbi:MAG: hypothetical protein FWF81_14185 [Defluviitaleaceae bacterium]|nr:hypothetical protein [Defluviitaleaceae bacterium]